MSRHDGRVYLLVTALSIAVLYGSTYQQFRFFDLANPGGATDAVHYVRMATGTVQPAEIELRHYRWLTPVLASLIDPLAARIIREPDVSIGLAFYIVNFAFSTVSCV